MLSVQQESVNPRNIPANQFIQLEEDGKKLQEQGLICGQRNLSSKASESTSPFYLTASASGATAAAVGLTAYYLAFVADDAYAMTPAEEGYV